MKYEAIVLYMNIHLYEAKKFKDVYKDYPSAPDKNAKYFEASYIIKKKLDGLQFNYYGYNISNSVSFMTHVTHEDLPVVQFITCYQCSDDTIYEKICEQPDRIKSNFISVSGDRENCIWLGTEKLDQKKIITKDEYFNYSLIHDIPSYELYDISTKLYDHVHKNVEICISEKILEIK